MIASRSTAKSLTFVTFGASLFLIGIGILVLTGWVLDIATLKGLGGPITMKANASLGLLACGLALILQSSPRHRTRLVGQALAGMAGVIGALTLSEHVVGWNLGIDELLFVESPGAVATVSPGRMGPNASTSLVLGGLALWWLYRTDERSIARAQILGSAMAVLALVPIVGYLYGAAQLYAVARYTGIALHTGISLLVLSVGILAARPDRGPVAALTARTAHASVARRLVAMSIALPLSLGYVRMIGERRGWYDTAFGASAMVVVAMVLLSITLWRAAVVLARMEARREEVQKHRDDLLLSERVARERAERADHAKDEFIAALSHELRTPLNAILGWMQMLQHGVVSGVMRDKAVEAVNRNAGLLARLIEDLLDTSRMTTGRLELSKDVVDINAVARAAADSVLPAAAAKDISITVVPAENLPLVYADGQRLQQVMWNLLSNAIKFSPQSGQVTVHVSAIANAVRVTVHDEGNGIDAELLPHIFDRFRRGEGLPSAGGLGLGLYIAKHLAELHGGRIDAHSAGPGQGATFTIHLPADVEEFA